MKKKKINLSRTFFIPFIIVFYLLILFLFLIYSICFWPKVKERELFLFFLRLFLLFITFIFIVIFFHQDFISIFRNKLRFSKITDEEWKFIEDAKKLIQSIDQNIPTIPIHFYKVPSLCIKIESWFYYDKRKQELCIFIPFKILKRHKDSIFMVVVHEMLHAYNLRNNIYVFQNNFLEGLTQFFTLWLIENYSTKYFIPPVKNFLKKIKIGPFILKFGYLSGTNAYQKEINIVKHYFTKYHINTKKCFLNYVNLNKEFFYENLPEPSIYLKDSN